MFYRPAKCFEEEEKHIPPQTSKPRQTQNSRPGRHREKIYTVNVEFEMERMKAVGHVPN